MTHTCRCPKCTESVPPRMLMCLRHWRMLPPHLQRAVLNAYRPGQEADKRPSAAYLAAAKAAVAHVGTMA